MAEFPEVHPTRPPPIKFGALVATPRQVAEVSPGNAQLSMVLAMTVFGSEVGDASTAVPVDCTCVLKMRLHTQGRMIATGKHIMFLGSRGRVNRIIGFEDVVKIEGLPEHTMPTLNVVCSNGNEFYFSNFRNMEGLIPLLHLLWAAAAPERAREGGVGERDDQKETDEEMARRLANQIPLDTPVPKHGWPKTFTAFDSVVADNADLELGDKMILPHEILQEIENSGVSYPWNFEVANADGRRTHCGVLCFTAPPLIVYLPRWVMRNLGIDNSDRVQLDFKGVLHAEDSFVQLQPVTADWIDIPFENREAILLDQLGHYQSLTTGDCIPVRYSGRDYEMVVVETRPYTSISLINTNLATDVIEPLETPEMLAQMDIGTTKEGTVLEGEYDYVCCRVNNEEGFSCVVTATEGDPLLFVSNVVKKPTRTHYTWRSIATGDVTLSIGPSDAHFHRGNFYVAVHSWKGECKYSLTISDPVQCDGKAVATDTPIPTPDASFCPHCHKNVRAEIADMHIIQCARRTYFCEECRQSMAVEERAKHDELMHAEVPCACGARFPPAELQVHAQYECPMRMEQCRYCVYTTVAKELTEHEERCGARTTHCSRCGSRVVRKHLGNHLASTHNINPINGVMEFASDMTPTQAIETGWRNRYGGDGRRDGGGGGENFSCPGCGTPCPNFEELQVHVLIVCPDQIENIAT